MNRVPLVDNFDFVGGRGPQFDFPISARHFRNLANSDPDGPFGPYRDPSATIGNVAWQITSDIPSFPFTSTVTGALDDQVPNAGSIPLFRLRNSGGALTPSDTRTQRLDDRIFGGVEYILRLNTQGGTTPEAADCTAESVGSFRPVDYEADYYFLVPR